MSVSLNELEVVAHKAALGAGLPVGHAEEAARFAGWLARAGFEPARALRDDLAAFEQGRAERCATWCLPPLCDGLAAGPVEGPARVVLAVPLLAAAAVATAANDLGLSLCARWSAAGGGRVLVAGSPERIELRAETPELPARGGPAAVVFAAGWPGESRPALPLQLDTDRFFAARRRLVEQGVEVAEEAWGELRALAARTLVPASERSRLSGAGAGDIDREG